MLPLVLEFADGEYAFAVSVEGLLELQEHTGVGIGALFARVLAGRYTTNDGQAFGHPLDAKWHVNDLLETIRLALIGGGKSPIEAKHLVKRYCYPAQPLADAWSLAAAILAHVVEGIEPPKEGVKKKRVRKRTTKAGSAEPVS